MNAYLQAVLEEHENAEAGVTNVNALVSIAAVLERLEKSTGAMEADVARLHQRMQEIQEVLRHRPYGEWLGQYCSRLSVLPRSEAGQLRLGAFLRLVEWTQSQVTEQREQSTTTVALFPIQTSELVGSEP